MQQGHLIASDGGSEDDFGSAVAVSGDTAVVGSPGHDVGGVHNQGAAYVFVRTGDVWTEQAQLLAPDGADSDSFGWSVAISGDTIVVGARSDKVGANEEQGSAYVFTRNGTFWTLQAHLFAFDGAARELFGTSVAVSGDTAIIGTFNYFSERSGSAYIYRRTGGIWTQEAHLFAANPVENDRFGYSVAISGDTVVVGAHGYPGDTGVGDAVLGSAYVFSRSGSIWTQEAQLIGADTSAADLFGISVGISGDTAIVGAYAHQVGANPYQGSAYVFRRSGTNWAQETQLLASDGAGYDTFGCSVAISGETAVVGANSKDIISNWNQGSAYVFTRSGTVWSQDIEILADDGASDDRFGFPVAISGDDIVVGARSDDVGANQFQGSAYVFVRGTPAFTLMSAASRKNHSTAGVFDIPLPLTGEPGVECRTGSSITTLVFTFSNWVVSGDASVTAGVGNVADVNFSGTIMRVLLTGVADAQKLSVTLHGVTDSFAQTFPDLTVSMNILVGDINGSKVVSASDIAQVKDLTGVPVDATNFRADVAANGTINASDIGLVKSRSGQSVP
jgi:hypothetical protein